MSTLIMDELFAGVVFSQTLTINRDVGIAHIRPWIYKEGTLVDGDFVCRVKDGVTLIKEVTINFATINEAIPEAFAHGFIRFDMEQLTLLLEDKEVEKEYQIEFEMINHVTDISNFIAINRSWENKVYDVDTPAPNDMVEPGGIEIYEFKENL